MQKKQQGQIRHTTRFCYVTIIQQGRVIVGINVIDHNEIRLNEMELKLAYFVDKSIVTTYRENRRL